MDYIFSEEQGRKLEKLMRFMLEYNRRINLTRITEEKEVLEKHFKDSALPLALFDVPRGTSVLDVGTGAGFPGAVWNILRPDLGITLLDSLRKRTEYLKLLKEHLSLSCEVVNGRSEELAHKFDYREKFDIVVSRAVANLPALLEYMLPFLKLNGYALAMKGAKSETENAENAVTILGGKIERLTEYTLPSGDKRNLVVIKKISQTPTKYPRLNVNIPKHPL